MWWWLLGAEKINTQQNKQVVADQLGNLMPGLTSFCSLNISVTNGVCDMVNGICGLLISFAEMDNFIKCIITRKNMSH